MSRDRKDATILGIGLSSTEPVEVLRFIRSSLERRRPFVITTPNPEQLVMAQSDPLFKSLLNASDLAIPDGVGLAMAHRFLGGQGELPIIKGREMFGEIIRLANKLGWKVFLLGGRKGVSQKAVEALKHSYQKVGLAAADGPELNADGKPVDGNNINIQSKTLKDINNFNPDVLFVGFGAPKQEKWLKRNLNNLEIGGAMVVGSTFEYYAGSFRVAPNWVGRLGLEWFYRWLTGSTNLTRIVNAVVVFPWKVITEKVSRYRPH